MDILKEHNDYVYIGICIVIVFIFLIALLLNNKLKGVDFSKSLIFSPAIIAPIIVGIIWVYILDPNIGIINNVLDAIGASGLKQKWIGGNTLSPYSIAIIYFWQQLGYLVTVFIAGLKMIPGEVLEAVEIDGASFIQKTIVCHNSNDEINDFNSSGSDHYRGV